MAETSAFYLARAAECARDAQTSTLDHVRDRCRRAEAAWTTLAERLARNEARRDRLAAEKAASSAQ